MKSLIKHRLKHFMLHTGHDRSFKSWHMYKKPHLYHRLNLLWTTTKTRLSRLSDRHGRRLWHESRAAEITWLRAAATTTTSTTTTAASKLLNFFEISTKCKKMLQCTQGQAVTHSSTIDVVHPHGQIGKTHKNYSFHSILFKLGDSLYIALLHAHNEKTILLPVWISS